MLPSLDSTWKHDVEKADETLTPEQASPPDNTNDPYPTGTPSATHEDANGSEDSERAHTDINQQT